MPDTVLANTRPSEMRLSLDGSKIYSADRDGHLRVYNALTGQLINDWLVGQNLAGIDISPNGSFLVITDRNVAAAYKVDTATGAVTTFSYVTGVYESPFFD